MPEVSATFKIGWKGCELSASVDVPTEPVSPRQLLPMVQRLTNSVVEMGKTVAEACGATISCTPGCGACCRQLVPVTETEARHLRDLVEALPEPRRTDVRERFADAKAKLGESGILDKLQKAMKQSCELDLGIAYFRIRVPCPFLEDENCSIYEDRPLTCREYLVTSPAVNCQTPTPETIDRIPIPGFAMTSFAKLDGPAKKGVRWVPLVLAPEWADEHPAPPVAIPGTKQFEAFMNALLNGEKIPPPGDFTHKPVEGGSS